MCKEKKEGSNICVKSKNGKRFNSYRTTIEYMKENSEFTNEDLDRVCLYPNGKNHICKMNEEDWITNEYLPEGWTYMVKKEGSSNIKIQTETGFRLRSYKAAAEYMEKNSEYSKDDMEKLYFFPDGNDHALNLPLGEAWKTNEYLPTGWMCKDRKSGLNLKTDTGLRFWSYRAAAVYMEETMEFTKEDIEKMYMYPDGKNHAAQTPSDEDWITNEFLPEGWMCKERKEGTNICVKTNNSVIFRSYRLSIEYMEENIEYRNEDIARFHLYPDGKNHSIPTHSNAEWKTSEYLPPGWKYKETGTHQLNLLTEDGTRLSSYIAATRYMQYRGGYTSTSLHQLYTFPDGKNHFVGKKMPSLEG